MINLLNNLLTGILIAFQLFLPTLILLGIDLLIMRIPNYYVALLAKIHAIFVLVMTPQFILMMVFGYDGSVSYWSFLWRMILAVHGLWFLVD